MIFRKFLIQILRYFLYQKRSGTQLNRQPPIRIAVPMGLEGGQNTHANRFLYDCHTIIITCVQYFRNNFIKYNFRWRRQGNRKSMLFFGIRFNFIKRGDRIFINGNRKNSKNPLFSNLCKNFRVEKTQRKSFKNWLLYDTTIDPFLLSGGNLGKEDIQEIEDWLKEKQKELLRWEKEGGSRV